MLKMANRAGNNLGNRYSDELTSTLITLPSKRLALAKSTLDAIRDKHFVCPGNTITEDIGYMRGHGTYLQDNKLKASVAGFVEKVGKLICVKPVKSRYNGEVGDVVVGIITEVGQRRWKVDTYSRLDSLLMLSAVNLPGGELRRRSEKDELMMRQHLTEGDLISAEVQSVHGDGSLALHTRSLKYGKLIQGTLVTVAPALIKRCKTHFHNLECGASIILGNNGYIWISPLLKEDAENQTTKSDTSTRSDPLKEISLVEREIVARLRNCIMALAERQMLLYDTSITYTYEASLNYQVRELLQADVIEEITDKCCQRLL
ncbi:Exosome complex component RRP4 [Trichoplax sp. H2]|nr:Exosome complex component RRP4 [Trichoplax sp. H2]|eukprot:RDD43472.1 Exosome complex component RRP4 [Trichoplax sp. H2]